MSTTKNNPGKDLTMTNDTAKLNAKVTHPAHEGYIGTIIRLTGAAMFPTLPRIAIIRWSDPDGLIQGHTTQARVTELTAAEG
jgi:hypothetical protein